MLNRSSRAEEERRERAEAAGNESKRSVSKETARLNAELSKD